MSEVRGTGARPDGSGTGSTVQPPGTRSAGARAGSGGQGIVEFGVILALAVVVAIVVLVLFRPQLAFVLSLIGSEVEKSGWLLDALAA